MDSRFQNRPRSFKLEDATRKSAKLVCCHDAKVKHIYGYCTCFFLIVVMLCSFSDAEMNITFEVDPSDYEVFEGTVVHLVYQMEARDSFKIIHNGIAIVRNSVLLGSPARYTLIPPTSNNVYILRLNQVKRNDSGKYVSRQGIAIIKQLDLKVYYPPNRDPLCTSSHDSSTYFFGDMIGNGFEFNCTVEDGNPKSEVVVYQEFKARERHVLDVSIIKKNEGSQMRTVTFLSRFNSSYNTSRFFCEVRQKMPPSLKEHDYKKTCLHGPLTFVPVFKALVSPPHVTIKEGESVTLTCTSNVESAGTKWSSNFTDGIKMEVKEGTNNARLILAALKGFDYDVVTAVCKSSFENRYSSKKVKINIIREPPKYFITITLICIIGFLIVLIVICSVLYLFRKKEGGETTDEGNEQNTELLAA